VETFRLEVDVNGTVSQVLLRLTSSLLSFTAGTNVQTLRDDGLNGDRVAGDHIFTSERIRYNGAYPIPNNLYWNSDSPAGLHLEQLGTLSVVETNGATNDFLILPTVGVLSRTVPVVETVQLASNILACPHLVNISTGARKTQQALRSDTMSGMNTLSLPTYSILPDAFDFFIFFSIDHAEYVPNYSYSQNAVAGAHLTIQVKYMGTGLATNINDSGYFGSSGRLLGMNILDTASRGIADTICTHELLHQWVSHTSGSLGLTTSDGAHYNLGLQRKQPGRRHIMAPTTNGAFVTDCPYSDHAPALDLYMMGLISGSSVPPLRVASNTAGCYSFVTNYRTVTISDIQAIHGVRTPTPATAQKSFVICFAAETFGRLFNSTELTFYGALAGHYTKAIPPEQPAPLLQGAWAPISRYFAQGSSWSSSVLDVIRPQGVVAQRTSDGTEKVVGNGYPGRNYRLLRSTNLVSWTAITNVSADTNGAFTLIDKSKLGGSRFYRVNTP